MSTPPRLAVIVGAGASHDVCPAGEAINDPQWQPPIINTMFDSRAFDEILALPGRFAAASSIMSSVRMAEAPFEDTLRRFLDSPDTEIQRQVEAVPIALYEFFYRVRQKYTQQPISYSALVNEIRYRDIHTAFITVNYETFLDDALKPYADAPLNSTSAYISSPTWLLIKLHGSVGWGYPWPEAGKAPQPADTPRDLPAPVRDPSSIAVGLGQNLHRGGSLFYPALALPVTGKYEFVCPPSHVEALKRFLGDCENFLFIGFSANDQDLLDLLAQTIPPSTVVAVVAEKAEAVSEVLERLRRKVPQFTPRPRRPLSRIMPDTRHFPDGFGTFVKRQCGGFLDSLAG